MTAKKWILICIALVTAGLLDSCQSRLETASEVLDKSIEAHGGLDLYQNIKSISYKKEITLFDSSGNIESNITQYHTYSFSPQTNGAIHWNSKSKQNHMIRYINDSITYLVNDTLLTDKTSIEKARSIILSSHFVLFQPFKLADDHVHISFSTGEKFFQKNSIVITPEFTTGSNDRWKFILDSSSKLVIANMVNHNGRLSFINNLTYDTTTALTLHKSRKSYFLDTLTKKKVLRAAYFYKDYEVIYKQVEM